MATKKLEPAGDVPNYVPPAVGYNSVDRKGTWFLNKGTYPLEDPTNAGNGPLTRFEPGSYTQATETNWTGGQHQSGVLVKFSGDPRDEGTVEVPYEGPVNSPKAVKAQEAAAPAPAPALQGGHNQQHQQNQKR